MTDNLTLQTTIISNLFHDEDYARKVLPHLKDEYFDEAHGIIFRVFSDFVTKYNKIPNSSAFQVEIESCSRVNDGNSGTISEILVNCNDWEKQNEKWLLDKTEKWCQDRAVFNAVMESFSIVSGKSKDKTAGSIPDMLQKALGVSFDASVGHDYIINAEHRYEFYHKKENKIPFDLDKLNEITKGGIVKKTLTTILAGCVHPDTKIRIRKIKKS